MEAFSDAVIAIIITIMVLELKIPHGTEWSVLKPLIPIFLSYVMSFVYLGIYWNNHHHLLQLCDEVSGPILWANMHLLFWLSLVPFVTGWMGENHFTAQPTALYGFVLLMASIAYFILQTTIIKSQGEYSRLRIALGKDIKGRGSVLLYILAVTFSYFRPWAAVGVYVLVALIWLIPDRRIETAIKKS